MHALRLPWQRQKPVRGTLMALIAAAGIQRWLSGGALTTVGALTLFFARET